SLTSRHVRKYQPPNVEKPPLQFLVLGASGDHKRRRRVELALSARVNREIVEVLRRVGFAHPRDFRGVSCYLLQKLPLRRRWQAATEGCRPKCHRERCC